MGDDYARIAEGMGAIGIVVREAGEIGPALERAQQLNAEGRTVLLDIHTSMESRQARWDR